MMVNELLKAVVKNKASDLHLVAGLPPIMRIAGDLQEVRGKPLAGREIQAMAFAMLDKGTQDKFLRDKELDVGYSLPSGERFRVNLHFEKGAVSVAARAIPRNIPDLDEIGLREAAKKFTGLPHGLVLVTGPTG